jgi:hypothetical protein
MTVILNPDPLMQNNLLAFGWECGEGWYPLIQELIDTLNFLEEEEDIHVLQVKEKFGTLRFYISGGSENAYSIIERYEIFSSHVCELCGAFWTAENRVSHGWWKTLCNKCAEERNWK